MQTFRTKFTTDVSQHRRAMGEFRAQTCPAVQEARNQLLSLGAVSFGGIGAKELIKDIILLGGEMQQTKTAFEVMLGSAEKGRQAIEKLVRFADVTPFDNPEIIQSGKLLLNVGVTVNDLTAKLETLGNIAAGTGSRIAEITAIYTKAATKGIVQTREIMQLAEHGVPVIQKLSEMLKITSGEVMDMAEKGQISFGLLDEALSSLSGKGGQYFGLMEKQSKNLLGVWSNFQAEVQKIGTEIGERALPQLTVALEDLLGEIDKLRQSGDLDRIMAGAAQTIGEGAAALRQLVSFIMENRETIASLGMDAAKLVLFLKAKDLILQLGGAIVAFTAAASKTIDSATLSSAAKAIAAKKSEAAAAETVEARKAAVAQASARNAEAIAARKAMMVALNLKKETAAAVASAQTRLALMDRLIAKQQQLNAAGSGRLVIPLSGNRDQLAQELEAAKARHQEISGQVAESARNYVRLRGAAADAWKNVAAHTASAGLHTNAYLRTLVRTRNFARGMGAVLTHPFAAAKMAAANFGAVAATAFIGWQIGKRIAEMLKLEDAFTRMMLRAKGMSEEEIDYHLSGEATKKVTPDIAAPDLAKNAAKKKQLQKEIAELEQTLATLEKKPVQKKSGQSGKSDQSDQSEQISAVKKRLEQRKQELAAMAASEADYEQKIRDSKTRWNKITAEIKTLNQKTADLVRKRDQTPAFISAGTTVVKNPERDRIEREISQNRTAAQKLNDQRNRIRASQREYERQQKAAAAQRQSELVEQAKKTSEAEKAIAARKKAEAEKRLEEQRKIKQKQQEIDQERKSIARGRRDIRDEQYRDSMAQKVEKWQEEIEKYQKQIDETERKLRKLGASVDDNLLKSPQEIAQARKDEILRRKIEAYNKGARVQFSGEEKARIKELQDAQKKAQAARKSIEKNQQSIKDNEKTVRDFDRKRRTQDWKERSAELNRRAKAVSAAQKTIKQVNDGKKPVQSYLDLITQLLRNGLPSSTV